MDRAILLDNAVDFLKDPQVKGSNQEKQRQFLLNKGMSEQEIAKAMELAGLDYEFPGNTLSIPTSPPPTHSRNMQLAPSSFSWTKFFLYCAFFGSASFALSQSFFTKYGWKLWKLFKVSVLGSESEKSENKSETFTQLELLMKEQQSLKKSLKSLQSFVNTQMHSIQESQQNMIKLVKEEIEESLELDQEELEKDRNEAALLKEKQYLHNSAFCSEAGEDEPTMYTDPDQENFSDSSANLNYGTEEEEDFITNKIKVSNNSNKTDQNGKIPFQAKDSSLTENI